MVKKHLILAGVMLLSGVVTTTPVICSTDGAQIEDSFLLEEYDPTENTQEGDTEGFILEPYDASEETHASDGVNDSWQTEGQSEAAGENSFDAEENTAEREALLKEIEEYEAGIRKEKEEILKGQIKDYYESTQGEQVSSDAEYYFVCTDSDTDYAIVKNNGDLHFYSVYISRNGDYFVSGDGIGDNTMADLAANLSSDQKISTERFWNKVALMYTDGAAMPTLPRDANGVMCVPYYNQGAGYWLNGSWACTDWPDVTFNVNGHTMHQAGCGFFSTAMAMSYVKQTIIAPVDFKENGQYIAGDGSAVTVGVESAKMYGISAYITSDFSEVLAALQTGHPVMEHVGPSVFTNGGHYILLVGMLPDGTIAVNDPGHCANSYWYNGISFSQQTIMNAAKDWSTAFTIFG